MLFLPISLILATCPTKIIMNMSLYSSYDIIFSKHFNTISWPCVWLIEVNSLCCLMSHNIYINTFVKVIGMLGSGCNCSGLSSEYCCCCFSIELKASLISLAAPKTRVSSSCIVCSHWTQTPATYTFIKSHLLNQSSSKHWSIQVLLDTFLLQMNELYHIQIMVFLVLTPR